MLTSASDMAKPLTLITPNRIRYILSNGNIQIIFFLDNLESVEH